MARYATLLADPARTYRSVDLASRSAGGDPHRMVGLLYEEAVAALRAAAWGAENREYQVKSDKLTRAIAILFALESNLDHSRGGDVASALSTFYRGLRQQIVNASIGNDPAPFRAAAESLLDIASAWESVRA
tara:strand:- start:156 stop:551 length:396 start_codon:yes stop_codon:yes gene_type:complete